ncbi:MAG: glycosyltransferase family 4 protein [Bacteroidota bacterium]|nr:glycosyltransferase family 4 protein [Bacteroidota bacterium]MDP3144481.1 glycosyltransferase family 4 protein [Bacteroidota bacterium]
MKTKVTYVISQINKAVYFEWTAELMNKEKIELSFILLTNGNSELQKYLVKNGFKVKQVNYKNKYNLPMALLHAILFILKTKPNIVHAHLFEGSLIGLSAAWFCRVKKRIYTRHHSSYHHDYFPNFIKYDRLCNFLSTKIIVPTKIVQEILEQKEFVPKNKIQLIHHGFKLESFTKVSSVEILSLRNKYNLNEFYPKIGVVSRYIDWKGVQYIVPAFKKILLEYPNAKLILANADGPYEHIIKNLLKEIPNENYVEIDFENNLFALFKLFDVFVHVPIDQTSEAFGQVYVESLASSVPSVFTLSGIANDFIIDKHNALVVDYKNTKAIYEGVKQIIENKSLASTLINNGKADVENLFDISKMILALETLYLS